MTVSGERNPIHELLPGSTHKHRPRVGVEEIALADEVEDAVDVDPAMRGRNRFIVLRAHQHVAVALAKKARSLLALRDIVHSVRGTRPKAVDIRRRLATVQLPGIAVGGLACGRKLDEANIAGFKFGLNEELIVPLMTPYQESQGAESALVEIRPPAGRSIRRRPVEANHREESLRPMGEESAPDGPLR